MKVYLALFAICLFLQSCTTTSTDPGSTNMTFTPPTTSYFKVDGTSNLVSADAPHTGGAIAGVTKAFQFGSSRINGAVQISFKYDYSPLSDIAEGTYKTFYVSSWPRSDNKDSVKLSLEMDEYPKGVYLLNAATGKVFASKKNGVIRCTSDGVIAVTGANTQPPGDLESRTMDFSIENGVSF